MNVDEMTIGQAREIAKMLCGGERAKEEPLPFKVEDAILIRTVTMIQVGRVRTIGRDFITLDEASWVADTARFSETLSKGTLNEVECCPSWVVVGRGAIVDIFPWTHALPKDTK